jgi:26S proteasome regulatory subunit N1
LGIAYAGTRREEVLELLLPIVSDTTVTMELSALAALSLGLVFVGTCNGDVASTILQTLMERDETSLKDTNSRLMGAGLALLFVGISFTLSIGRQEAADATLETLKVIEHPISKTMQVMVEMIAYAGMFFKDNFLRNWKRSSSTKNVSLL